MQQSPRIPAIDTAKGIGIFCIILGHVIPNSFIYSLLYAFHVPLFFLLSGLTFHPRADKRRFYCDKARRILVPYAAFSLFSILVYRLAAPLLAIPAEQARLLPNVLGMLYANTNNGLMNWNRPLWFLPCLFAVLVIVDVFESCLRRMKLRRPQMIRVAFALASLALGALLNVGLPGLFLPFHLESAVLLTAFAELGVILQHANTRHDLIGRIKRLSLPRLCAGLLLVCCCSLALSRLNGHIDIRAHMLGRSPVLLFIYATGFSLAVLAVSVRLQGWRFLRQWGMSSMSMLLMHKFPLLMFQRVIPFTRDLLRANGTLPGLMCSVAVALVSLYLCLAAEKLLQRFCPLVLGKTK
ncbi:MAG: acyltransferase [Clostridiales bacterium]|nr:acyltransferase [Clostridiales bacterium]